MRCVCFRFQLSRAVCAFRYESHQCIGEVRAPTVVLDLRHRCHTLMRKKHRGKPQLWVHPFFSNEMKQSVFILCISLIDQRTKDHFSHYDHPNIFLLNFLISNPLAMDVSKSQSFEMLLLDQRPIGGLKNDSGASEAIAIPPDSGIIRSRRYHGTYLGTLDFWTNLLTCRQITLWTTSTTVGNRTAKKFWHSEARNFVRIWIEVPSSQFSIFI